MHADALPRRRSWHAWKTAVLLLALWPTEVAAWSDPIHTVICQLAWELLSPEGRALVREVRAHDEETGETFGESCIWADETRFTTHPSTYEYHFMNVREVGSERIELARDCPANDCVPLAVERYAVYLREPARGERAQQRRAHALAFLGHFVADLHQPLHVGYGRDRGGNTINVKWATDGGGLEALTLHRIWDHDLPVRAGLAEPGAVAALLAQIEDGERAAWRTLDVVAWAEESYVLARQLAYTAPPDAEVPPEYVTAAIPVVREQLEKAAVRLAFMIDAAAGGTLRLPGEPGPP